MNKLLIIWGLLLFSCAPTKVLTESNIRIEETVQNNTQTNVATKEWLDKYLSERAFELSFNDVEFKRVEFDTSKPVDSLTGKPPIKSETIITDKSRTEHGTVKESQEVWQTTIDSTHIDKSSVWTEMEYKAKMVEKKGLGAVWGFLFSIGAVVAIFGAVWIAMKKGA